MNAGGVRNPGFLKPVDNLTVTPPLVYTYPYDLTYGDAFTVQPFGNSLVTMTLTAQQIKDVLEQQFAGCKGQGTANRIMQISNGFNYKWSLTGTCGTRISEVTFTPTDVTVYPPVITGSTEYLVSGGVVTNPTQTYRVTVNNFMATGGDGFSTFVGGLSQQGGAQDIDALVAYLTAGYKSPNAYDPTSPVLGKPRIVQLP
jgi:5'-nucleotidase